MNQTRLFQFIFILASLAYRDALGDTTTYTFAGVTSPSLTHVARDFHVNVDDPEDPPSASDIDSLTDDGTASGTPDLRTGINGYASDAEATQGQYDNIESSNNNRWTITDPGAGLHACFWAKFQIAEAPSIISQIDVKLEGYQGAATDKAWLGIWRAGAATPYWEVLEASQQTSDHEYTGSITSSCDEYIDDSGDLYIIFFNEDDDDSLFVDYVEVKTTWSCGNGMFGYMRTLTIESDLVGTDSSGTLPATGFPVLVSLDAASSGNWLKNVRETGGHIEHPKGYDIIFRDTDLETLYHEIEEYDGATGTLVAWVRVDSLSKSADTTIYMYYGNDCIRTATAVPTSVWDSSFLGVWHLAEQVTDEGTTGIHYDSTGVNNGAQNGNDDNAGKISDGQIFDGTDDYISLVGQDIENTDYDAVTISVWYKSSDSTVGRPVGGPDDEYIFTHMDSGWNDYVNMGPTDDGADGRFRVCAGDGGTEDLEYSTTDVVDQQWRHLVMVRTGGGAGSRLKAYVDGDEETNVADGTGGGTISLISSDEGPFIGDSSGVIEPVHGILD